MRERERERKAHNFGQAGREFGEPHGDCRLPSIRAHMFQYTLLVLLPSAHTKFMTFPIPMNEWGLLSSQLWHRQTRSIIIHFLFVSFSSTWNKIRTKKKLLCDSIVGFITTRYSTLCFAFIEFHSTRAQSKHPNDLSNVLYIKLHATGHVITPYQRIGIKCLAGSYNHLLLD